jgi:hypothetical protein
MPKKKKKKKTGLMMNGARTSAGETKRNKTDTYARIVTQAISLNACNASEDSRDQLIEYSAQRGNVQN